MGMGVSYYVNGFHMTEDDKLRMLLTQLEARDTQIKLLELKATYLQNSLNTIGKAYVDTLKTLGHHRSAQGITDVLVRARSTADDLGRYKS